MRQETKAKQARFQPYHEEFEFLVKAMKKPASAKDWNFEAAMYGKPKIRGASVRMWKTLWPEALHFESWIGNADIERGSASLAFHIETSLAEFGVRRNEFNRELIEQGAELMDNWERWALSPKSFQTGKRHVPFKKGRVVQALKPEFSRLRRLGKLIDGLLNL